MLVRVLRAFCVTGLAVALLACLAISQEEDDPDPRIRFAPCTSVYLISPHELEDYRRQMEVLGLFDRPFRRAGNAVAALVVDPAFEAEWSIRDFEPEHGACAVVFVTAAENVFAANRVEDDGSLLQRPSPATVPTTRLRRDLPFPLASRLGSLWEAMLSRLRVPREGDPAFVDGTSYTAFRPGGRLCG